MTTVDVKNPRLHVVRVGGMLEMKTLVREKVETWDWVLFQVYLSMMD